MCRGDTYCGSSFPAFFVGRGPVSGGWLGGPPHPQAYSVHSWENYPKPQTWESTTWMCSRCPRHRVQRHGGFQPLRLGCLSLKLASCDPGISQESKPPDSQNFPDLLFSLFFCCEYLNILQLVEHLPKRWCLRRESAISPAKQGDGMGLQQCSLGCLRSAECSTLQAVCRVAAGWEGVKSNWYPKKLQKGAGKVWVA